MNTSMTLLEQVQISFLSASKSKHSILREAISILSGRELVQGTTNQYVTISNDQVELLLRYALYVLENNQVPSELQNIADDHTQSVVFLGLYEICHEAIRLRLAERTLKTELLSFSLPHAIVTMIITQLYSLYTTLTEVNRSHRPSEPGLQSLEWRIDVTISTHTLNKVFTPVIIMQLTTTQGKIYTFESSIDKFHQLRYSVARMLANMHMIEQHPTLMRLVD